MSKNMLFKSVPMLLAGFILVGCGASPVKPTPNAFNFDQTATDPSIEAKKSLEVEVFGSGIKNTKKFAIGAFQVRVRTDLSTKLGSRLSSNNHLSFNNSNDAVFQKVTESLYADFVNSLKAKGIQLVDIATLKKYPEYQKGLKGEFASGHDIELGATPISIGQYDGKHEEVKGVSGKYSVYYPNKVPGLNYVMPTKVMFVDTETVLGVSIADNALPQSLLDAANKADIGIITAAFDVELMKYNYYETDAGHTWEWEITKAPMVRTKLTALRFLPADTKQGGMFNSRGYTEGLRITSKVLGGIRMSGVMGSMLNSSDPQGPVWTEVDDGAVTLVTADESSAGIVTPVASVFPAAFKKATGAQLQMIMYAIDHQSDF